MKVCAHYNLGPFDRHHMRADSVKAALSEFRDGLVANYYGDLKGILERTGEDYAPRISFYPQCDECTTQMCFHYHVEFFRGRNVGRPGQVESAIHVFR